MVGTVILPPMIGWFASSDFIAALSPMTTLKLAQDLEYRASPMLFWLSLTLQFVHAATLLLRANSHLQRQLTRPVIETAPPVASGSGLSEKVYSVEPASNASWVASNLQLLERQPPTCASSWSKTTRPMQS